MSVGGKPNALYNLDSLVAELKLISVANGYFTTVKSATRPAFPPWALDQVVAVPELPALMVWLLRIGKGRQNDSFSANYPALEIEIVGVVKGEDPQAKLIMLEADVRRVMVNNKSRRYPNAQNTVVTALDTYEAKEGVDIKLYESSGPEGLGIFAARWIIESYFPPTTA